MLPAVPPLLLPIDIPKFSWRGDACLPVAMTVGGTSLKSDKSLFKPPTPKKSSSLKKLFKIFPPPPPPPPPPPAPSLVQVAHAPRNHYRRIDLTQVQAVSYFHSYCEVQARKRSGMLAFTEFKKRTAVRDIFFAQRKCPVGPDKTDAEVRVLTLRRSPNVKGARWHGGDTYGPGAFRFRHLKRTDSDRKVVCVDKGSKNSEREAGADRGLRRQQLPTPEDPHRRARRVLDAVVRSRGTK
eukprot:1115247-Prorocentrum_minimum.AAC.2